MKTYFKPFILIAILASFYVGAHIYQSALEEGSKTLASDDLDVSALKDFREVKEVFDGRCVACHSCYNAACQLKLSSFEGIDRGLHPTLSIYDNKRTTVEKHLTRLFVDAHSSKEWQEDHGFLSVLQNQSNGRMSLLAESLDAKLVDKTDPYSLTSPEAIKELSCAKNKSLAKPMPYGLPALTEEEHGKVMNWVNTKNFPSQKVLDEEYAPSEEALEDIKSWEAYLNAPNLKQKLISRYLFEHLFISHIYFDDRSEFFKLVRSSRPCEALKVIPSRRPYDKPEGLFSYCFQKVRSTIVHKTHITYPLSSKKMDRFKKLFNDTDWEVDVFPTYNIKVASNPFVVFKDIPANSRYQFLLDNAEYFIRTFIRGPVCRGSTAVNVINEQFFVMFVDPKAYEDELHDFVAENAKYLGLPAQYGSDIGGDSSLRHVEKFSSYIGYKKGEKTLKKVQEMQAIAGVMLDVWGPLKVIPLTKGWVAPKRGLSGDRINYRNNKLKFFKKNKPNGYSFEDIWDGGEEKNKNALLTILRHYDSASVSKGALGPTPKTMWLIDYPLLEGIYYNLVAGFDVYGDAGHQASTRYYKSSQRLDGEEHFLYLMPKELRKDMRASWYKNDPNGGRSITKAVTAWYPTKDIEHTSVPVSFKPMKKRRRRNTPEDLAYARKEVFGEIYENRFKDLYKNEKRKTAKAFDLISGKSLRAAPYVEFFADVSYIKHGEQVYSLVRNKQHYNVTWAQDEDLRRDVKNDVLMAVEGFVGSYPLQFFVVPSHQTLNSFVSAISKVESKDDFEIFMKTYGVLKSSNNFWSVFDFMVKKSYELEPLEAGVFDLNRYGYPSGI